jgi:hypothetical protein
MLGFSDMGSEGEVEQEPDRPILADQAPDPDGLEGQWTSPDREDAAHWVAVYQELIGVCWQLLDGADGPGAAPPSENHDRARMEARLRRFEDRQQFWLELLTRPEPPAE